ncbi:protein FAM32A-like isoform X1 [Salvia splendens]|uniref:protein FAM32A-like isoform X1 n=2 Tax=Salvia splendens TaxID=180675 RepID=UPI001C26F1D2|nr:protein FAM32A-like isoform X1 [Salvia splendens]
MEREVMDFFRGAHPDLNKNSPKSVCSVEVEPILHKPRIIILAQEREREREREMSGYENVIGGKLKLKGKALDVKAGGVKKKKKKQKKQQDQISEAVESENAEMASDLEKQESADADKSTGDDRSASWDSNLTPAERRYMEQRERIDRHKLAKTSNKSHRDRIEDFNQYLANMSEHYDIPKVGPG